ncbi:MAG: HAD-IIIA family hydrolase [Thermoplasmatales archaeon]|nr:HAD-IIIA family hydrolase [Thermoplasmatales archaeon]
MKELVVNELVRSSGVISRIDPLQIIEAADIIIESLRNGGQAIFMGNGGSSADAQHIAAELSGRYMLERPAMPGVCLSNVAPITAIANDYSYDRVFERQIEAFCRSGDAVVGLSTSGNSRNVILAMEKAKELGACTISFTGDCGRMREIADHAVVIPSTETPRVQEGYVVSCHIMCGLVERGMYGKKAVFIDRDDTIAKDVPYCRDPGDFHLFPGVPESIARLNRAGYLVIVVTNQSGVARGILDAGILESIHEKMRVEVAAGGGRIDDVLFCPHHPDDLCLCRKPEIGMGEQAVAKHGIDTRSSYMIGDKDKDVEFGRRLGCRTIKVSESFTFADAVDEIIG